MDYIPVTDHRRAGRTAIAAGRENPYRRNLRHAVMEDAVPKLCKFTSPRDGQPVYVNPEQVSVVYVHKGEPADTIIGFRKDFMLGVRESLEETVRMLEQASLPKSQGE